MEKITYGAPRLVDWVAQIKAGAATVRVHFTGGALTSYGVTPAEYTTDNPFIQKVIEQSTYFKEGRITLVRRTKIPDTAMPAQPATPKRQTPSKSEAADTTEKTAVSVAAVIDDNHSETKKPEEATQEAAGAVETETPTDNLTIVETSCLQDAQAYLQENYNISSYKVRTYEAAQRAACEHGVRFTGAKFDTNNGSATTEGSTAEEEE